VQEDAIDEDITGDLEIGAIADILGEMDKARVLSHAVDDVDRVPADAARIGPVEILDPREPSATVASMNPRSEVVRSS
jgi:hypothetical protein